MYNGIINIYKDAGFTSHDVVAKLRGILKQKKIGHTGTLDPDAVGVLPVCLGNGTKLCDLLTDKDKEYLAEIVLGISTDTEDMTGEILDQKEVRVTEDAFREVVASFVKTYGQIPPMYSAIKVNGKKLYELARQGQVIEREPRQVTIHAIEILEMNLPTAKLRIQCSKGTYIRSLCRDIGEALSCGAVMGSLVRSRSGKFELSSALTLKEVENCVLTGCVEEHIVKIDTFFEHLPAITAEDVLEFRVRNGNKFVLDQTQIDVLKDFEGSIRVYLPGDNFAGVYTYNSENGFFEPFKMFLNGV